MLGFGQLQTFLSKRKNTIQWVIKQSRMGWESWPWLQMADLVDSSSQFLFCVASRFLSRSEEQSSFWTCPSWPAEIGILKTFLTDWNSAYLLATLHATENFVVELEKIFRLTVWKELKYFLHTWILRSQQLIAGETEMLSWTDTQSNSRTVAVKFQIIIENPIMKRSFFFSIF